MQYEPKYKYDYEYDKPIDKLSIDGYIRWNKPLIGILNPSDTGGKERDRGDEITILMYVTNKLNLELQDNPFLDRLTIYLYHSQISNMLKNKPAIGKIRRLTTDQILNVIEKINGIDKITLLGDDKIISMAIYQFIEVGEIHNNDALYKIEVSPKFIEYYKLLIKKTKDYFKLYAAIMVSLNTKNAKILYAYICNYLNQMQNNFTGDYGTNPTNIDDLKFYLDNKKYRNEFGEWEFSLTNTNLIRIVEHSLEQINTLLEETNKVNNMDNPLFEVIWIRKDPEATNGKGCKLKEFRFRLKNKQDNRNINLKFNR